MSWETENFTSNEFDSPDAPGSGELMDMAFIELLQAARTEAGIPFNISSGYRTHMHNQFCGGVPTSAHCKGMAADVIAADSRTRFKIISAALQVGITRIGVASSFIHLDNDPDKDPEVIWTYGRN
jgi:uncharacterized protein YcbK (DUF882 family)